MDKAHLGCPLIKSRIESRISVPASVKGRHIPNNKENSMACIPLLSKSIVDCELPTSTFDSVDTAVSFCNKTASSIGLSEENFDSCWDSKDEDILSARTSEKNDI